MTIILIIINLSSIIKYDNMDLNTTINQSANLNGSLLVYLDSL